METLTREERRLDTKSTDIDPRVYQCQKDILMKLRSAICMSRKPFYKPYEVTQVIDGILKKLNKLEEASKKEQQSEHNNNIG